MGGVRQMLLTHRDDVADHELFRKKFGCERIMHADDGAARLGVERIIEGESAIQLDDDLLVIPTPGHTRGHIVFLYQNKFLFTGDHLAWSPTRKTLTAFPSVAWYSWARQTESMAKLAELRFRVGFARPRLTASRHKAKHAVSSAILHCLDENSSLVT